MAPACFHLAQFPCQTGWFSDLRLSQGRSIATILGCRGSTSVRRRLEYAAWTVTVQAAYSKRRRTDVLPLHPSIVAMLRPWLSRKSENQPVWHGNWAKWKQAGAMLRRDLKAAGILYKDENGRYGDFHALRHTF